MALTPNSVRADALYDNLAGYPENFSRSSRLSRTLPATNQKVPTTLYMTGYVDPSLQVDYDKKRKGKKKLKLQQPANPAVASRSRMARLINLP